MAVVDIVDATPAFLASAAERSADTSHRVEMFMSFSATTADETIDFESASPLATGVQTGDRFHYAMNLREMFLAMVDQFGGEEMPHEFTTMDLSMEFAGDPTVLYLRAPFLAAMGTEPGAAPLGPFAALGDGWGKVDLSALGDLVPGDLAQLFGGAQAFDPRMFLDLLRDSSDVEELGSATIRGEAVTGLSATVSLEDLLDAQQIDREALGQLAESSGAVAEMSTIRFPIEVWVNGTGQVARIVVAMSSDSLSDAAQAAGEDGSGLEGFGFNMTTAMDFFDYGHPDLAVEFPQDAVDLTEEFRSMLAAPGE